MDLNLDGAAAVVVGGANGIGLATCQLLAAEGCEISIWDVSESSEARADELQTRWSVKCSVKRVDIGNLESVRDALASTVRNHGKISTLVHAAAIGSGAFGFPFLNLDPQDWDRVLNVNIRGMVNVAHTVAEHMLESNTGSMVFLSSVAGQIGSPTDPPYSASKAANINFAQCMARDLAPRGIRVNTVCPGMVKTNLNRSVWQAWYEQTTEDERLGYEEWADTKVRTLVPLGRWQSPEDVANLIVFLSSSRAENITGQTMNVDGGYVMHW